MVEGQDCLTASFVEEVGCGTLAWVVGELCEFGQVGVIVVGRTQGNEAIYLMNPPDKKLERCVSGMLVAKLFSAEMSTKFLTNHTLNS